MLPTSGRAALRILLIFAVFILIIYAALGCLARVVRADDGTVAPLPGEVVARLESCKVAPGT